MHTICSMDDCALPVRSRGLCNKHYLRAKKAGDFPGRACSVDGCAVRAIGRGMCSSHYYRLMKNGDLLTPVRAMAPHGSGSFDGHGYRQIWRDGRLLKEHRVLMEAHLGRPLEPNENVHHRNGLRDDNRLENLEIWVTSQPSGQRVEDLADWLIDFHPEVIRRALVARSIRSA